MRYALNCKMCKKYYSKDCITKCAIKDDEILFEENVKKLWNSTITQ